MILGLKFEKYGYPSEHKKVKFQFHIAGWELTNPKVVRLVGPKAFRLIAVRKEELNLSYLLA